MPVIPQPHRLSLHEAINYVAERCNGEPVDAGKAVHSALGEGALVASANVLVEDRSAGPPQRVDAGVGQVPSDLWAENPWSDFFRRAVLPFGNPMFKGQPRTPVYSNPTIATADIDAWLDRDGCDLSSMHQEHPLKFKTPHKRLVIRELDRFIAEWRDWKKDVDKLGSDPVHPLNPIPGQVYLDGEENIQKHRILQEKTLAFLNKNLEGHGFIYGKDGTKIDRTDLRLNIRVKHRIDDLEELRARIDYAQVPAGLLRRGAAKIGGIVPDVISNVITKLIQG